LLKLLSHSTGWLDLSYSAYPSIIALCEKKPIRLWQIGFGNKSFAVAISI
jgi:hypothetical protein